MNINNPVIDVCRGSRMFYFDKRNESHILCDGRTLEIKQDAQLDFTNLPFPDEMFYFILFGLFRPPHLIKVGQESWLAKNMGSSIN